VTLPGKPLKFCSFVSQIFVPNGNGSTNDYVREPSYEITLEAARVLVRSRSVKDGQIVCVPLANVSSYEEAPVPEPATQKPTVAKA
jgi:hypothetical protein